MDGDETNIVNTTPMRGVDLTRLCRQASECQLGGGCHWKAVHQGQRRHDRSPRPVRKTEAQGWPPTAAGRGVWKAGWRLANSMALDVGQSEVPVLPFNNGSVTLGESLPLSGFNRWGCRQDASPGATVRIFGFI